MSRNTDTSELFQMGVCKTQITAILQSFGGKKCSPPVLSFIAHTEGNWTQSGAEQGY